MNTHSSKTVAIAMAAILASTNIFVPLSVYAETTKSPLTDINDQAIYKDGINYLIGQKIVSGYPDGTYRPSITLNRAEMLKILVGATTRAYLDSYKGKSCFDDVAANEWYTTYVCYGKEKGWVAGYENGKKFRPAQTVNTVEALKMTLGAFGITYTATSDVWYKGIVDTASAQNFIPFDVTSLTLVFAVIRWLTSSLASSSRKTTSSKTTFRKRQKSSQPMTRSRQGKISLPRA